MDWCGACRVQLRPGAAWCANCGAPVDVPRVRTPGTLRSVLAVVLLVMATVCVGAAVVAVRQGGLAGLSFGGAVTGNPVAGTAVPPNPVAPVPMTPQPTRRSTPPPVSPEEEARLALQRQVTTDRTAVDALVGQWVPQLSSKRLGLVVRGVTFGHTEVWADFQQTRARYPGALLLWSGEFTTFDKPDFWVTVMPSTFPAADGANGWCDQQGIGRDDCFAKRLSHVDPPAGSTKLR